MHFIVVIKTCLYIDILCTNNYYLNIIKDPNIRFYNKLIPCLLRNILIF